MVGERLLTAGRVLTDRHDAYELHHAAILVREYVAVEHERAREVHEGVSDTDPAGRDAYHVAVVVGDDDGGRDGYHVLPDEVVRRRVRAVDGRLLRVGL